MSKKRTSDESSNDEQTKDDDSGSVSLFQEDCDAKRAKLTTLSDTTLQDLPLEVLESILIKAVTMEVKSMELSKSVWKEKVDHVISRLRTVCSQWNTVLTANFFRNELDRTLDSTGQESIRLEVLHQPSFPSEVHKLTTLKDEIFLLYNSLDRSEKVINVYDRNNLAEVKDVISLPGMSPVDMAACSVSNCVYILDKKRFCPSVFRITKDEENHFKMSPWISDLRLEVDNRSPISVSANGSLIILSSRKFWGFTFMFPGEDPMPRPKCPGIYIYAANGFLQHGITFSPDVVWFNSVSSAIQKSNGNLVLLSSRFNYRAELLEVDAKGEIVRRYKSSLNNGCTHCIVSFADIHSRILITDDRNRVEILDAEFNPLEIVAPPSLAGLTLNLPQLHFNSDRNEIVRVEKYEYDAVTYRPHTTAMSFCRITED